MSWWLAKIEQTVAAIPVRLALVLMVALTAAGFVRTAQELDALDNRLSQAETNDRFLTCRALELDAGRDPAACRYFLQGNAEEFRPPVSWRLPAAQDTHRATVP